MAAIFKMAEIAFQKFSNIVGLINCMGGNDFHLHCKWYNSNFAVYKAFGRTNNNLWQKWRPFPKWLPSHFRNSLILWVKSTVWVGMIFICIIIDIIVNFLFTKQLEWQVITNLRKRLDLPCYQFYIISQFWNQDHFVKSLHQARITSFIFCR